MKHLIFVLAMIGSTQAIAQQTCTIRQVPVYQTHNQYAGAVVGGIIGNQIGNGQGKTLATVLGMLLGSQVAQNTNTRRIIGYRQIRVCEYSNSPIQYDRSQHFDPTIPTLSQCNVGGKLIRC